MRLGARSDRVMKPPSWTGQTAAGARSGCGTSCGASARREARPASFLEAGKKKGAEFPLDGDPNGGLQWFRNRGILPGSGHSGPTQASSRAAGY